MDDEATTTEDENQREMKLRQDQLAAENAAEPTEEGEGVAKPAEERFINSGEATLLLAFTGAVEIIQWIVDLLLDWIWIGEVINIAITIFVAFILFIWLTGKIAKGAPKKWLKAVYYGAAGGALPIIPGYLGAIIYLLIQDRKILGKVAGKLGEEIEKTAKKAI